MLEFVNSSSKHMFHKHSNLLLTAFFTVQVVHIQDLRRRALWYGGIRGKS